MQFNLQYIAASVIAIGIALAGLWFGWRQLKTLAWLRVQQNLSDEDRQYYQRMVTRRLLGCFLLLAMAVSVAGLFGMGILERLDDLMAQGPQAKKEGRKLSPEQQEFMFFSMKYVIVMALITFGLIIVAFLDVRAIRKFGNRHRKRIRDDRAAMLQRQLPLLYQEKREGMLPESPGDDDEDDPDNET